MQESKGFMGSTTCPQGACIDRGREQVSVPYPGVIFDPKLMLFAVFCRGRRCYTLFEYRNVVSDQAIASGKPPEAKKKFAYLKPASNLVPHLIHCIFFPMEDCSDVGGG